MIYVNEQIDFPALFDAVGCICRCKGNFLLLKRIPDKSYPGHWGIPSGRVNVNESLNRAVIRELFEETGILLSSENLLFIKKYYIISNDMSFSYSIYICNFESYPSITIRSEEHSRYGWFTIDNALRLNLIPDLEACLLDALPSLKYQSKQLELFPNIHSRKILEASAIEETIKDKIVDNNSFNTTLKKPWFVSFGPPCSGKTTALKAMHANENLPYVADNRILRRGERLNYYLRKAFEEDERSFFFHFQMEILPVRFWQTIEAPQYSLVDETIFSTLAYSRTLYQLKWITPYEYQTFYLHYLTYLKLLPRPNIIYYFTCDTETILRRIIRRKRKIEKFYTKDYIEALCQTFAEVAKELVENYNLIEIDTTKKRVSEIVEEYGPAEPNLLN